MASKRLNYALLLSALHQLPTMSQSS